MGQVKQGVFYDAIERILPNWEHLYHCKILRQKGGRWIEHCWFSSGHGFYEPIFVRLADIREARPKNPMIGVDMIEGVDLEHLYHLADDGKLKVVLSPRRGYALPETDVEFGTVSWWR